MGIKRTLGGDRLGTGKKMTVELENFGRSTFNLNKVIRFDQAFGVLQPAYCAINLNGGTFYIDVKAMAKTLPTNGPIMGRAKYQIDFFTIPIRLYIAALHNNAVGVGLKMNKVFLPQFTVKNIPQIDFESEIEPNSQQVSQDSLLAYLGIRGLGNPTQAGLSRKFPAIFLLAMWDAYKNYYANKQEEIGVVVGAPKGIQKIMTGGKNWDGNFATNGLTARMEQDGVWKLRYSVGDLLPFPNQIATCTGAGAMVIETGPGTTIEQVQETELWVWKNEAEQKLKLSVENGFNISGGNGTLWNVNWTDAGMVGYGIKNNSRAVMAGSKFGISLNTFELSKIDDMREAILAAPKGVPYNIGEAEPYKFAYEAVSGAPACLYTMAGLPVKTYMSDRFNNWLSTEWIDGVNGINDITAVDVSDGKLTMNALILSKKLFNMMNRIAISGGSYVDWQEAVWGVRAASMAESPIYCGGMSFDIVFDEIVSNSSGVDSEGNDQPLGSLAGRGTDARHRGGKVKIKATEPSMILAIASCTPYIDYSQGNKWWNRLETMDDFHKPDLDRIGFQELLTEEFAAADTTVLENGELKYNSVGKQTSWIEYQTDTNETFGDFSAGGPLEWMAFNRKYTYDETGKLEDATTYIDPTIYNVAFADTSLTTKPLWMQIAFNIEGRRVMGAKQIPNL